jgi:hypothetical protein
MKYRDPLLDLWRGLSLVDMTWVHLATYPIGMSALLAVWIGDYTRFAAGAFVLISGMSVARVFGAKLAGSPQTASATRLRLLKRALMLAGLDRLVAVAFVVIDQVRSLPPNVPPKYPDLTDLILFREPGVTGGLLLLYAVLLIATPLIDAARRRFGSGVVLVGSLGVYAIACVTNFDVASTGATWPFPIGHWQILFVLGYLVSDQLGRLRDPEGRLAIWWLVLISVGFATLLLSRNGAALGLLAPSSSISRAFVKVPLSPAELVWYVTASGFVLTWSAWLWEGTPWLRQPLGEICRLGRKSLLVYVAHLYLQLPILEGLTLLDPPPWGRALVLPLSVVILIVVAMAGEGLDRMLSARTRARPFLPTSGIVGSAFAVGAFLTVISLQGLLGMPAGWSSGPIDGTAYQADAGERQVSLEAPDGFDGPIDTLPWLPDQPAEEGPALSCPGGGIDAPEVGCEQEG